MFTQNISYQKIIGLFVLLVGLCSSMEVVVKGELTCLEFQVDQTDFPMLFSYHMNPHIDEVNMIVYDRNTRKLDETGSDMNYKSFIQIKFNQTGLYPICFEKKSARDATVQFDILDEEQKMLTAGKQDINKLSKKISEFLIEIRKTGWEFKQVLDQHNKMKDQLDDNQNKNYWIFASKMVVMSVIIIIQFFAVKYMFQ